MKTGSTGRAGDQARIGLSETLGAWRAALWVGLLLVLQVKIERNLNQTDVPWVEMPWSQLEKWNPLLYRTMSFGHLPAAVDWLWMRSLQDPSYSHVPEGVHPPAFYDLDLATDLDDAYYDAYIDGALHLVVVRDDEAGAEALLLKADRFRREKLSEYGEDFRERFWIEPWQVPMILGYVYLLELYDVPKAAAAFTEASQFEQAPLHVKMMVERLKKPGGIYEVAFRLVDTLNKTTKDDRLREEFNRKRHSIQVLAYLDQVERSFREMVSSKWSRLDRDSQWTKFLSSNPRLARDPWGGRLGLDEQGRVTTTTPYESVFNLR
jgi:hypothetical protein